MFVYEIGIMPENQNYSLIQLWVWICLCVTWNSTKMLSNDLIYIWALSSSFVKFIWTFFLICVTLPSFTHSIWLYNHFIFPRGSNLAFLLITVGLSYSVAMVQFCAQFECNLFHSLLLILYLLIISNAANIENIK